MKKCYMRKYKSEWYKRANLYEWPIHTPQEHTIVAPTDKLTDEAQERVTPVYMYGSINQFCDFSNICQLKDKNSIVCDKWYGIWGVSNCQLTFLCKLSFFFWVSGLHYGSPYSGN